MTFDFKFGENAVYYRFLIGVFLVCGGTGLIGEHWLNFGYLEFELFGHETYGVIVDIIGIILTIPYLRTRFKNESSSICRMEN